MQAPGRRISWRKSGQHDYLLARWTRVLCHDPPLQTGFNVSSAQQEQKSVIIAVVIIHAVE